MIVSPAFADKHYALLGLARSGLATLDALVASGAKVTAWDGQPEPRARAEGKADIADLLEADLSQFDAIILSPGVPLNTSPIAERARAANLPIIGDVELFAQARVALPPHKVVGITGTNGKSTTTALIAHILKTAGRPSLMAGNIGLPILSRDPLEANETGEGVYVLELSSYQIDLTESLACDIAVLLNITPDHLDRYENFEAYAASKARLFAMQHGKGEAVIGIGDTPSALIARGLKRPSRQITKIAPGVCMDQSRWPSLQGPHNAQNALAAIAACEALGVSQQAIDAGLESFSGLPHRLERLGTFNGVAFVNDSKATNPASAAPALAAFDRIRWIVGGLPKDDNLDECAPNFGHVVKAYTIGDAGPTYARQLAEHMEVDESEMLATAVRRAVRDAQPGDTVLLSPACASFDQFRDFEARGECFREAVSIYAGGAHG